MKRALKTFTAVVVLFGALQVQAKPFNDVLVPLHLPAKAQTTQLASELPEKKANKCPYGCFP